MPTVGVVSITSCLGVRHPLPPITNHKIYEMENEITYTTLLITPALAEQYLRQNTSNRSLRPNKVEKYAKEMREGRWKEGTGDTIKICPDGRILDGQHRLAAIVKAEKSFHLTIADGVSPDVFDVLDIGSSRTARDMFKIAGKQYDSLAPAIIRRYIEMKSGKYGDSHGRESPTPTVLLETYDLDPKLWNGICNNAQEWGKKFSRILEASVIGSFYALTREINTDQAFQFMEQLCTGNDIANPTIATLRQKLLNDKVSTLKMPTLYKDILIIKTWNAFRNNKLIKNLKFESAVEEYPVLL